MAKRKNKRITSTNEGFKVVDLDLSHLAYLLSAHDLKAQESKEPLPKLLTAKEQITYDKMISRAIDKAWLSMYGRKK